MQQEYKDAMQSIILSDEDKKRILANVKKAAENPSSAEVVPIHRKPRPFVKRGAAVAACLALCAGIVVYAGMRTGKVSDTQSEISDPVSVAQNDEVNWVELDNINEISQKTDCKTYTLGTVSHKYRVKKVEVANEQRHVRITYKNKKGRDRILFEYKETEDTSELAAQFEEEDTLSTEKVDNMDVTMYGSDNCDGMTWQEGTCTFAVRMTKGRSKKAARCMVSRTKKDSESHKGTNSVDKSGKENQPEFYNSNAVGWYGDEEPSDSDERDKVLKSAWEKLGFRVKITDPADQIAYKMVGNHESFAYYYTQDVQLDGSRIIGYAGTEGCPEGVLTGYTELQEASADGITAMVYENEKSERAFQFTKDNVVFTFLIEEWTGDDFELILGDLLNTITVSWSETDETDAAASSDDKNDGEKDSETGNNGDGTNSTPAQGSSTSSNSSTVNNNKNSSDKNTSKSKEKLAKIHQQLLEIQDAVDNGSFRKIARYAEFPLTIRGKGRSLDISGEKELITQDSSKIFTDGLVSAVTSYEVTKVKADAKTVRIGTDSDYVLCRIEESSVRITELRSSSMELSGSSNTTPSEE